MAWVTENQYMIKMLEEILEIVREQNKTIQEQDRRIRLLETTKGSFVSRGGPSDKMRKTAVTGRYHPS